MHVREIRVTLKNKLQAVEDRGQHHVFFYLPYRGKEYFGAKVSHSWRGDLNDQQIDWVKKGLLLTKREFEELVDCPLTKDRFFQIWANRKGLV